MRTHQIIHFSSGNVLTVFNVVGVREKKDTHLKLEDGRRIGIVRENVDYYEILTDDVAKRTFGDMFNEVSANEGNIVLEDKEYLSRACPECGTTHEPVYKWVDDTIACIKCYRRLHGKENK